MKLNRFGSSLDRKIPDLGVNVIDHSNLHSAKVFMMLTFVNYYVFACELLVLDKILSTKLVHAACIHPRYKKRPSARVSKPKNIIPKTSNVQQFIFETFVPVFF